MVLNQPFIAPTPPLYMCGNSIETCSWCVLTQWRARLRSTGPARQWIVHHGPEGNAVNFTNPRGVCSNAVYGFAKKLLNCSKKMFRCLTRLFSFALRQVVGKITMHNRFHGFSVDGLVVNFKRGGGIPFLHGGKDTKIVAANYKFQFRILDANRETTPPPALHASPSHLDNHVTPFFKMAQNWI